MFSPGACPELHNGGSRCGSSGRFNFTKILDIRLYKSVRLTNLKKLNFYTNYGISLQGAKGSRWQDLAEAVSFGAYLDRV